MEKNIAPSWIPDETQQAIINLQSGYHLVLAPPGCGKTQILAERICLALKQGRQAEDMLCLTFTNRAARGMRERIERQVSDRAADNIFVGNVHRFCSRYLYDNHVIAADSAIIDDDTVISIIAMYLGEEESRVNADFNRRKAYSQIMFFSHLMYELKHQFPKELRTHPECMTSNDVAILRELCRLQGRTFDVEAVCDIYEHNDFYTDLSLSPDFQPQLRHQAQDTLYKMRYAHAYEAYKKQNSLLDFEDLLQYTYTTLVQQKDGKHFGWIQIDEVQDLNPLQLAIIDQLSGRADEAEQLAVQACNPDNTATAPVIMYLGDEQQAIFSFMGAKMATLELLKVRCAGSVHHLGINHRSPRALVNLLNTYAMQQLGSDQALLPVPADDAEEGCEEDFRLVSSADIIAEYRDVAEHARCLYEQFADQTTAVIVNSNQDADRVSQMLTAIGCDHFKVSGSDLFATPEVKLLLAHVDVLGSEHNFLAWSRIMQGFKVCETNASARQFVHQLEVRALSPTDFLGTETTPYLQRFLKIYEEQDIVVFDTETTGLCVFDDDIIQIAAEKIRQGRSIAKFSVHIKTDKPILERLGDVVNPIIEERLYQQLYEPEEALRSFISFAGDGVLLAHNASFDYHIMNFNLKRYLPEVDWTKSFPQCFDSLKLIRLLRSDLKAFKLKLLLKELSLKGENSHLADDDVNATVSLVNYCFEQGKLRLESQNEYLKRQTTIDRIARLRSRYTRYFQRDSARLYDRSLSPFGVPALVDVMREFYHNIVEEGWIHNVSKIDYVFKFLATDVINEAIEPSLIEQLSHHALEINTFKEADLCSSKTIEERIFVSTIHKAKGLEFDNVIVFDAVDGRIPNFYNVNSPSLLAEDARKLYVALSRSKRRLFVYYNAKREPSRFLRGILEK